MTRTFFYYAKPSLFPDPKFKADKALEQLDASKNDKALTLRLIGRLTVKQRQKLAKVYSEKKKSDFIALVQGIFKGDCKELTSLLFLNSEELDAQTVKESFSKKDRSLYLVDAIMSRTNYEIDLLCRQYFTTYKVHMIDDIAKNCENAILVRALKTLLEKKRPEPTIEQLRNGDIASMWNKNQAMNDAEYIRATFKTLKDDSNKLVDFLLQRSVPQLRAAKHAYTLQTGKKFFDDLKDFAKKENFEVLNAIAKCLIDKAAYFADRFFYSVDGIGTKDDLLRRLTCSRVEKDLEDVKLEYARSFTEQLDKAIIGDTSGDYMILFSYLVGN